MTGLTSRTPPLAARERARQRVWRLGRVLRRIRVQADQGDRHRGGALGRQADGAGRPVVRPDLAPLIVEDHPTPTPHSKYVVSPPGRVAYLGLSPVQNRAVLFIAQPVLEEYLRPVHETVASSYLSSDLRRRVSAYACIISRTAKSALAGAFVAQDTECGDKPSALTSGHVWTLRAHRHVWPSETRLAFRGHRPVPISTWLGFPHQLIIALELAIGFTSALSNARHKRSPWALDGDLQLTARASPQARGARHRQELRRLDQLLPRIRPQALQPRRERGDPPDRSHYGPRGCEALGSR